MKKKISFKYFTIEKYFYIEKIFLLNRIYNCEKNKIMKMRKKDLI